MATTKTELAAQRWPRELLEQHAESVRFLMVGSLGFTVNFVVLWFLHGLLGLGLVPAQLLASEAAILSNLFWHHNWTYRGYARLPLAERVVRFHVTAWSGAMIGSVTLWGVVAWFGLHYLAALVVGAGVAMVWNYLLNKYVVWAKDATKTTG